MFVNLIFFSSWGCPKINLELEMGSTWLSASIKRVQKRVDTEFDVQNSQNHSSTYLIKAVEILEIEGWYWFRSWKNWTQVPVSHRPLSDTSNSLSVGREGEKNSKLCEAKRFNSNMLKAQSCLIKFFFGGRWRARHLYFLSELGEEPHSWKGVWGGRQF